LPVLTCASCGGENADGSSFCGKCGAVRSAFAAADLAEVLRLAGRLKESAAAVQEAIGLHEQRGNTASARELRRLLAEPPSVL